MIGLIDGVTKDGLPVVDSITVVMSPLEHRLKISVERLPVHIVFDETPSAQRKLQTGYVDDELTFTIMGGGSGPSAFDALNFARADDGRLLTAIVFVNEVHGERGVTRVVHFTVTASDDGQG